MSTVKAFFSPLPGPGSGSLSLVKVLRGDGDRRLTFTLIHSSTTMAAQDFNFLLATDSYKVS